MKCLLRPSEGFWEQEKRALISGEQGSKNEENNDNVGEQGNLENQDFDFGEQGNKAIYFSGTMENR